MQKPGQSGQSPKTDSNPWHLRLLAFVAFGVLMAIRSELHSIWIRALVAGCAFGFLSWTIYKLRSVRS